MLLNHRRTSKEGRRDCVGSEGREFRGHLLAGMSSWVSQPGIAGQEALQSHMAVRSVKGEGRLSLACHV